MSHQPFIIPRTEHSISRRWISPNALRVLYRLKERGHIAYLVGGGVRDLLLGREPKDFDIATDARPNEIKKIFRNCRLIGRRFRLAHIHFSNEIIEVATFRSNMEETPPSEETPPVVQSPPPEPVVGVDNPVAETPPRPRPPRMLKTDDGMILRDNVFGTPEQDAIRRDFTVNALFYSVVDYSVIDYVGGMEDVRQGLIRLIGDPAVRFTEDPVRMVRAVRFSAMLGFTIERATEEALLALKDRIALASPARMYEEVQKLFLLGAGEKTYQLLRKTGLFSVIFPRLNAWVDKESGGFPHTWIGKALAWIDACVQAGRKVEPHIAFGLLYGQCIVEQATAKEAGGAHPLDAITAAVAETLTEQAERVQIPRRIGLLMRDMYWNQHRFNKREGRHPRYFLRRPGFRDAWEYLRFSSETTGEQQNLRAWWKDFIHANPIAAGAENSEEGAEQKRTEPPRPAKRRRRRRRPWSRKKPGTKDGTS